MQRSARPGDRRGGGPVNIRPGHRSGGPGRGSGRVLGALAVGLFSLVAVIGCGGTDDVGDRLRDAAENVGDASGLSDEVDDARDVLEDRIDEERDVLEGRARASGDRTQETVEGRARDTTDDRSTDRDGTARFCDTAELHLDELAAGLDVDAERRLAIYRDLRAVAVDEAAAVLDTAIDQARLARTAPERADTGSSADAVHELVARTCN